MVFLFLVKREKLMVFFLFGIVEIDFFLLEVEEVGEGLKIRVKEFWRV